MADNGVRADALSATTTADQFLVMRSVGGVSSGPLLLDASKVGNPADTAALADRVTTLESGAQTIEGIKTFAASPLVPKATGGDNSQAAASTSFVHDAIVGSIAIGLSEDTWAHLNAISGTAVGQGAQVLDSDAGTHTDPVVGGTVANAGTFQWSASPAGWKRIGDTGLASKAPIDSPTFTTAAFGPTPTAGDSSTSLATTAFVRGEIDTATAIPAKDWVRPHEKIVYQVDAAQMFAPEGTSYSFPAGGSTAFWAKAVDPIRTFIASAALIPLIVKPAESGEDIHYKVYRRLRSSPSDSGPGVAVGDVLLLDAVFNAVAIGFNSTNAAMQVARLPLGMEMTPAYTYIIAWCWVDAGGAVKTLGAAPGLAFDTSGTSYSPGWYGAAGFDGSYALISSSSPLAFTLLEQTVEPYQAIGGPRTESASVSGEMSLLSVPTTFQRTLNQGALTTSGPFQLRTDHSVTIPDTELVRGSGKLRIPAQTIALADIGMATVAAEAHTLSNAAGATPLAYRYAQSVVVSAVGGGTLVEGVDYLPAWEVGSIIPVAGSPSYGAAFAGAGQAVTVAYSAGGQRYDVIYVDPVAGTVGVATGTTRNIDPEEYMPAVPAGMVALYSVYFFRITSLDVVELIPIHQWRGYVRVGHEAEHQHWLEYCRARLPNTFRKLARGEPVKLACYGDSNTAMGVGGVVYTRQTNNDVQGFLTSQRFPADTSALYNSLQFTEDGNTKVPLNWPWFVKAAMESRWGSKVTYGNFGISGSGSGNTAGNGSYPARMAGLVAWDPDICLISFGMNEAAYSEMATIIQTFQAAGIECVILGCPAWNFYAGTQVSTWPTKQQWMALNEMLVRVARDNGCAYVPTNPLFALGNEGAHGLSSRSYATTNTLNHSGIKERRILGEYAALIFDGEIGAVPSGAIQAHTSIQAPTTGFSITIAPLVKTLVLNPAGTLASGTIIMPASPQDEQVVRICSSQVITALAVSPSSGQSILNAPTTLAAGAGAAWTYDAASATWYRLQ